MERIGIASEKCADSYPTETLTFSVETYPGKCVTVGSSLVLLFRKLQAVKRMGSFLVALLDSSVITCNILIMVAIIPTGLSRVERDLEGWAQLSFPGVVPLLSKNML